MKQEAPDPPPQHQRPTSRLSLREFFGLVTILALLVAFFFTVRRARMVEKELATLQQEVGYLGPTDPKRLAAIRIPSDQPLTYRLRVQVPAMGRYRIAYSSLFPRGAVAPKWYGAVRVPAGESLVTIRIAEDPRDDRWKINTLVGSKNGTNRMGTVLPEAHVDAFRGSHDVVRTGVGRETVTVDADRAIRLLDERWLVGEGSLLLYGDRAPQRDQIGVYAELQPDSGPL